MIRNFNTWNSGAALIAIPVELAIGTPWCWFVLGMHLTFCAGLLVGRWVVTR